ncbi:MAG: hypothetical protein OXQ89_11375 [Rhodospirillaceae bacterium]|nr:hypothetical protein [Rhodospirillaceae bacterium]MDD9998334.1 hypothetical protein [Rhodospirillaceae bacterium]MDE0362072.1 hypothetical protein [Rhodospirillaceae bacterium]
MKDPREAVSVHSVLGYGGVVAIVIVGLLWLGISLHTLLIAASR